MSNIKIDLAVSGLPSRGLPYPDATVSYAPYTYGEISDFNDSKMDELSRIEFISKGISFSEGIDNLTYSDFLYLMLLRRLSSLGADQYKIQYTCSSSTCKHTQVEIFSAIGFDDLKVPKLPVKFTTTAGKDLEFSPLTLGGFKELFKQGLTDDSSATMAMMVGNLEYKDAFEIISNATGEDTSYLITIDKLLYHDISTLDATCEKCKTLTHIKLEGEEGKDSLILPFREEKRSSADRIRFG